MKQIVFADDSLCILDIYKTYFSSLDLRKHFVNNFDSLISICKENQVDIVVMDTLDRIDFNGKIKKLQEVNANIKIIIVTGSREIQMKETNITTFHKPFDLLMLKTFIQRSL